MSNSAEFAKQINYIGEKPAKLDKLIQTGYTVTSFYKQEIENDLIVNKINQMVVLVCFGLMIKQLMKITK